MATMKEKWDEFVGMLGGDKALAESVVKQAEATEKEADGAGLKCKEEAAPEVETEGKAAKPKEEGGAAEKVDEMDAFAKKFMPLVEKKMADMIAASRKEISEKEAGTAAQIAALQSARKEANDKIMTLAGDMPRGVRQGFSASLAESTLTTKAATNEPKPDSIADMFNWVTESLGSRPPQ